MSKGVPSPKKLGRRYQAFWEHLPAALTVGVLAVVVTGDKYHLMVALLFGWLIDSDHLFDYLLFIKCSSSKISIKAFAEGNYFKQSGRLILPFHSFEIAATLAVLSLLVDSPVKQLMLTSSVAMTANLAQDHIIQKPTFFGCLLYTSPSPRD